MEKPLQTDSIDDDLRNGLWNVFLFRFVNGQDSQSRMIICKLLWAEFFRRPLDEMPQTSDMTILRIREWYFNASYNRVYDLLMFLAEVAPDSERFKQRVNMVLEEESSAYRFIDDYIGPITDDEEIHTIQSAISAGVESVKSHLKTALHLLSDKDDRNYRNSIKESISAVEALCCLVASDPNATLSDALKKIEKTGSVRIHPSLKAGYDKIYGYTSDADGIRHAMKNEPTVRFEDAQYMLVSCSAFINYLIAKANAVGLRLS